MRKYLFPAVLFFTTGLLCVKIVALISGVVAPMVSISTASAQGATDAAGRLREQQLKLRGQKQKEEMSRKEIKAKEIKGQEETDKLFRGENLTARQNKGEPSKSDIALKEGLTKRRITLEKREKGLDLRESLIAAAEKKVEERIRELKKLESRVTNLARKNFEENTNRFKKLVSMYEKMKPKEAARIFNSLQMGVLVGVAERMKERKIAAIMAKMEVKAAKRLTIEIARREIAKSIPPSNALPKVTEN
jgi:flagellar motility protein MotE (MotC chaperone)